jgi:RNA recognition motif-containing protein
MTTIYVGNLPFNAREDDIRALFARHGTVETVKMVMDRDTGRFRGFAFVEMPAADAPVAIEALNAYQINGRPLRVNAAQERPAKPARGVGPYRR